MSHSARLLALSTCYLLIGCPAPSAPNLPGGADAGAGVVDAGGDVTACAETSDCAADQVCVEGVCEAPYTGCRTDRDCDECTQCYDGVCIRECGRGGDACPDGLTH